MLPNILQKQKKWNRINRLRVENRNVKQQHSTSKWNNNAKPLNHYSNGRSQYLQMIVELVLKSKKWKYADMK